MHLQFDFLVDKEQNTITVRRAFAAERPLVWDCYTKSELLDQWFAPAPFTLRTKSMDFSEGGRWLYAMVDPAGNEFWARTDYTKIDPIDSYQALDGFCDANGELNPQLPRASWDVTFTDQGEHALVETVVTYNSLADLETVIQMGLKEGLTATLNQLDTLLEKLTK